jgi:hypothetical protein
VRDLCEQPGAVVNKGGPQFIVEHFFFGQYAIFVINIRRKAQTERFAFSVLTFEA